MKKLRSQHYILLVLSVLAIFASAAAYFFMYNDAMKKAQEEANVQASVKAASKHAVEVENMKTIYDETAANRALLPSFLVSAGNAVPFIDAVEAIGPESGSTVSISSLSSGTDSNSSLEVVTATISAVGTWQNVMRAVEMIEDMPYAISVKNLHLDVLSSSDSSAAAPHWTATMDISVLSSS
jgi:Tfp pilus assembly protein PilO